MPGTKNLTEPKGLLLRVGDVANTLDISVRHVWSMYAEGLLPEPIRLGRCTRWRESDIRRWLERQGTGTNEGKGRDHVDECGTERAEEQTP